jgi:hypothetical protein
MSGRIRLDRKSVHPSKGSPERSRRAQDERIYSYKASMKVYTHSISHRARKAKFFQELHQTNRETERMSPYILLGASNYLFDIELFDIEF